MQDFLSRNIVNKDIARRLTIKERIARKHLKEILTKPDAISRTPRAFPCGKFPTEKCRINETRLVRRGAGNYLASQ
jgi:hypothetical protein